ncbi:DsbA family protein [Microbacterium enclense]|uniref:DsbA family protein n=1 Tax=Microbacterium enclense TaxID=993073 RepID=UPI0036DB3CFC
MPAHPLTRVLARVVTAASLVVVLGVGATACAPASPSAHPTSTELVGGEGGVSFDEGWIRMGTGPKIVDVYVDPMCPYCRMFEEAAGGMLAAEAEAGRATVRIHPVAILNRLSRGTEYSSRAAAVLTAAAATTPSATADVIAALFRNQPAENTVGLTDDRLLDIVVEAGADPAVRDIDLASYRAWVDAQTATATRGPLPTTADAPSLQGVPLVLVNGDLFSGNGGQESAFRRFYDAS